MTDDASHNKSRSLLRDRNLRIIFSVTLMAVLGVSSITPAFPKIAVQLGIAKQSVGLLIIAFTLPGIFLTPLLGVLADRHGRKAVLVPSLLLFAVAGGCCGFVRDFQLLLLLRCLQGIGAAALGSLNITLIGDLFAGEKRMTAMGYNAGVLSMATASYPFLGGALATLGWYYPFFLPFLAIPVSLAVLLGLQTRKPSPQRLRAYLNDAFTSLRDQKAVLYFFVSMVVFIILYGSYLTYLPIFLAERFRFEPLHIGVVMSLMSVATAVTSSKSGRLAARYSKGRVLRSSFLFYGAAMLLLPLSSSWPMLILTVIVYGVGHGMNIPAVQTLLAGLAPFKHRGAFMSMNGMVLRLGQTLGPLIMGGFYLCGGTAAAFVAGAVAALLMFILLLACDNG
ncbi:MFS transporter [candidate division KSB1 bacterium]|nr:MFS transporter [candidate division KSB1 bacterium]RQW11044.1 MAG: MFS transporter [candidate division KSB1 bacterium]